MAFTLHRIAPFIPSAMDVDQWADICVSADQWADICATAAVPAKKRGRPRGPSSQRKPIPLPDGDMLTPLLSLFSALDSRLRGRPTATLTGKSRGKPPLSYR